MNRSISAFARSFVTAQRQTHLSQPGTVAPSAVSLALLMARLCALIVCLSLPSPAAWAQTNYAFQFAIGGTVNNPQGLATDAANNLYVADTGNNRIVKFSNNNGHLSFLGKISGTTGNQNGQFSSPTTVAVDSSGYIYVADSSNNRIQKFDSNGKWVWSSGTYGPGNGQFQHPLGVAVDGAGNVYVADTNNNRIQELNSQGAYVAQFGSPGSGNTNFSSPTAVAVDLATGNIYVLDYGNGALKQFNSTGTWIWTVGGFNGPYGLTVDATTDYVDVADTGNRRVMQYNNKGTFIRQIGSGGNGNGQFAYPYGIAVDSTGDVFVSDYGYYPYTTHNTVWRFDSQGNYLSQFGQPGYTFSNPLGVGVDSELGTISVADTNDHRVMQFDSQGNYFGQFGGLGNGNGQFVSPYGVAVDGAGDIYVTDLGYYPYTTHDTVWKFDSEGSFLWGFGSYGSGNGQFSNPESIALDSHGDIFIADTDNDRVQGFGPLGNYIAKGGSPGTQNGQFQYPTGVAVDRSVNIYVVDNGNNRIQKFDYKGDWLWSVGGPGTGPSQFNNPFGIAVDTAGNVYVCDTGNGRIQKFDGTGKFLTQFSIEGWGDPFASSVACITVDAAGKVYVTEDTNSRLVVLVPVTAAPTLTRLTPNQVTTGSATTTVTVKGTNFVNGTTVTVGSTALATTFVSTTELTATLPANLLTTAGNYNVTATNPSGGASNALPFSIVNPAPTLASLNPNQTAVGSPATTVILTGTNFVPGSTAYFGATALVTTFVSSTQLTATIPASKLTTAGGYAITVTNAAPGGGTSNAVNFTVGTNPLPVVSGITPNQAPAGSPSLVLTVNGSNFINGATIKFAGTTLTTAFVSSSQVTASIPTGLLANAGNFAVNVDNPGPGGGNSNSLPFTVVNPTPVLTGITPAQVAAGAGNTTLTLTGSGFTAASKAQFNGTNLATTFVSATQLTAVIPASQLATPGYNNITVSNAGPGGGTSGSLTFSVLSPTPTLSSLSPNSAAVGSSATTITLTGTNFVSGATVSFGGTQLTNVMFVSSTQLTATIPASLLATAGSYAVVVTNPSPGGGDSSPLTFTVM